MDECCGGVGTHADREPGGRGGARGSAPLGEPIGGLSARASERAAEEQARTVGGDRAHVAIHARAEWAPVPLRLQERDPTGDVARAYHQLAAIPAKSLGVPATGNELPALVLPAREPVARPARWEVPRRVQHSLRGKQVDDVAVQPGP